MHFSIISGAKKIFAGGRFVLVGFDPVSETQYQSEIFRRGGVAMGRYDSSCTHVIVSGRVYEDPICVVARNEGKRVVSDLWINDCVELEELADPERILYKPVQDLNGIPGGQSLCICLTGYQRRDREYIMKMTSLMGARFSKSLIANQITHLICYKFEGEKYDLAKKVNIKLVNHKWLEDCLKNWTILQIDNYKKSSWELEFLEAEAKDSDEETANTTKINSGEGRGEDSKSRSGVSAVDPSALHSQIMAMNKSLVGKHEVRRELLINDKALLVERKESTSNDFQMINIDKPSPQTSESKPSDAYLKEKETSLSSSTGKDLLQKAIQSHKCVIPGTNAGETPKRKISARERSALASTGSPLRDVDKYRIEKCKIDDNLYKPPTLPQQQVLGKKELTGCSEVLRGNSTASLPQKRKIYAPKAVLRPPETRYPHSDPLAKKKSSTGNKLVEEAEVPNAMEDAAEGTADYSCDQTNRKSVEAAAIASKKESNHVVPPQKTSIGSKNSWAGQSTSDIAALDSLIQKPANSCSIPRAVDESSGRISKSYESTMSKASNSPTRLCNSKDEKLQVVNCDVNGMGEGRKIQERITSKTKNLEVFDIDWEASDQSFVGYGFAVKSNGTDTAMSDSFLAAKVETETLKDDGKTSVSNYMDPNSKIKKKLTSPSKTQTFTRASGKLGFKTHTKKLVSKNFRCRNISRVEAAEGKTIAPDHLAEETVMTKKISKEFVEVIDSTSADTVMMEDSAKKAPPPPSRVYDKNKDEISTDLRKETKETERSNNFTKVKQGSEFLQNVGGAEEVGSTKSQVTAFHEPSCFLVSGQRHQRKEFQEMIRQLRGKLCRDSHHWCYQATHLILPEPLRRTEKFFAAAAAGRWILKSEYLMASREADRFLEEEPFEWYGSGLSDNAAISLQAPRKWRLLRQHTGHGAFYGFRIVVYGDCIAPTLDMLKRAVKAGDGTILAVAPPYTRHLKPGSDGIDFAVVNPSISLSDPWVQEFLSRDIPCIAADYLVEFVCKPGHPLDRHVLYGTQSLALTTLVKMERLCKEVVSNQGIEDAVDEDEDLRCSVCGLPDREEVMLICGNEDGSKGCGTGIHTDCCDPPLEGVPEDDWFCSNCR